MYTIHKSARKKCNRESILTMRITYGFVPLKAKLGNKRMMCSCQFWKTLVENQQIYCMIREHFQNVLKDEGKNDTKAVIVERFNRPFKHIMYSYFTAANTLRYVDVLQDLVKSYNNTYHRLIGMKPNNVKNVMENSVNWFSGVVLWISNFKKICNS